MSGQQADRIGVGQIEVVGDLGVILVRDGDAGEWTRHGCGTILPLWGVWGAAPDDLWAVGGDGFNRDPVACHFAQAVKLV